jgi:hypothetical protein
MAAELNVIKAESNTLRTFEERLRLHLDEHLHVRTRFADLGATRALLVSPADRDRAKGLVIDERATAAERVYMYVHVAAHIALGHNIPLVTIVEGEDGGDEMKHDLAERLARSMFWRGTDAEVAASLPAAVTSRVLRSLLSWGATRALTRWALLGVRALAYRTGIVRALERSAATAWLGQALAVAAIVSAAPQLASGGRGAGR